MLYCLNNPRRSGMSARGYLIGCGKGFSATPKAHGWTINAPSNGSSFKTPPAEDAGLQLQVSIRNLVSRVPLRSVWVGCETSSTESTNSKQKCNPVK